MANKKEKAAAPEAALEVLAEEIAATEERIEALERRMGSATFAAAPSAPPVLVEFSLGKDRYRFKVHGFSVDGANTFTVANHAADKDWLEKITKEYPGLVERINQ